MHYTYKSLNDLKRLGTTNAYAGGSNQTSFEDFKAYIEGKSDCGTCDCSDFGYCYYTRTQNVKSAENALLGRGFSCNRSSTSNCGEGAGFVNVLTKNRR